MTPLLQRATSHIDCSEFSGFLFSGNVGAQLNNHLVAYANAYNFAVRLKKWLVLMPIGGEYSPPIPYEDLFDTEFLKQHVCAMTLSDFLKVCFVLLL